MSEKVKFDAISYGDGYSNEIVALVAGFGSKPGEFNRAASELARALTQSCIRMSLASSRWRRFFITSTLSTIYEDFGAKSQNTKSDVIAA